MAEPPSAARHARRWICYICGQCDNVVFNCSKCDAKKSKNKFAKAMRQQGVQFKETDWLCPLCVKASNPGIWSRCFDCQSPTRPKRLRKNSAAVAPAPAPARVVERECIVCMERPVDALLNGCKHANLCLECARVLTECPTCRAAIAPDEVVKIFT